MRSAYLVGSPAASARPHRPEAAAAAFSRIPTSTSTVATVLGAELVTAAAVIVSSVGQPTPTAADLGTAVYLTGLGIAATAIAVRSATSRGGPGPNPSGVDLSPVWTIPAALLVHPALAAALVVALHTHRCPVSPVEGSLRRRVVEIAAAVLACLAARVTYNAFGGRLAAAPALAAAGSWSPTTTVILAVLCFAVIHGGVQSATASVDPAAPRGAARRVPRPAGRDENLLVIATSSLGGLTAAALAIHPLLVVSVVPAACCLHRAVLAWDLEQASRLDPKTGLLTAAAWHDQVQRTLIGRDPSAVPWAVLVIDLDHFKIVNDTHGHLTGDTVLAAIADALRAEVRDCDLVGRFGGDEFVVLLTVSDRHRDRHDSTALLAVTERIRTRVAALRVESSTSRGEVVLTGLSVSIGGAQLRDHRSDLHSLFHLADAALLDAKRAGRGAVRIATDPHPRADVDPEMAMTRRSRA